MIDTTQSSVHYTMMNYKYPMKLEKEMLVTLSHVKSTAYKEVIQTVVCCCFLFLYC